MRGSKIETQAGGERSFPRQFSVKVQWIEPVVLVRHVEQANTDFGLATRKAIPGEQMKLPDILVRQIGGLA